VFSVSSKLGGSCQGERKQYWLTENTHLTKLTTEKIELSSVFSVSQYTPNQGNHLKQLKGSIAANI
jgi:hypothetical protein